MSSVSSSWRRSYRRVGLHRLKWTNVAIFTWIGCSAITLWSYGNKNDLSPYRTVVHDMIDQWHLDDDGPLPGLSSLVDPRWSGYDRDLLFKWTEPKEPKASDPDGYGELGRPVVLPKSLEKEAKLKSSKHSMNLVASDLVSLNRSLPDYRNKKCLSKAYPNYLPQASVIIIFHNEARSAILRTVHSVINRSPMELLKEIILVDDYSDIENLKGPLDDYVRQLPVPARVVHTEQREGLIRTRLRGAAEATGSVLIFLDGHIEVTQGWLVPILSEIAGDRSRVILPVIDEISHKTLAFEPIEDDHERGGLEWRLFHYWIGPEPDGLINGQDEADAFPTPTMIGCAIAVDRDFFFESGAFDEKMEIWGGENIEMSLRIWLCGGSLLKHPCSRVGHLYRIATPHYIPGGLKAKLDLAATNTARFVEIYLGDFKNFYYFINPISRNLDIGDLSDRKALANKFQCHNFKWFLDHVYKDSVFPYKEIYIGQIQDINSKLCLDAMGRHDDAGLRLCHGLGGHQVILYDQSLHLRSGPKCLTPKKLTGDKVLNVTFDTCEAHDNHKWEFMPLDDTIGQLKNIGTGMCLSFNATDQIGNQASTPRMVLQYLSNIVRDVTTTSVKSPVLMACLPPKSPETKRLGQLWNLNPRLDWKSRDSRKSISQQRQEELDAMLFNKDEQ